MAFFGDRLFNWFGFSISDLFGTTSSLVDNYNSVCNSVLSLSVDSLDLRLDELPSGVFLNVDYGMEILDLPGLSVSCLNSSFLGSVVSSMFGCT